jgi:uncharacterized RDD family membrane protein YckC
MSAVARPGRDRTRLLVTPEGVALPVAIASRGARAGALMLDFIFIHGLMLVLTLLLLYLAFGVLGLSEAEDKTGNTPGLLEFLAVLWIIAMFLFRNAWFLFFELGPRGATPGKRLVGIRIAARDGGRLNVEAVIARNLLRDIELFMPLVFLASASEGGGDMGSAGLAAAAWFGLFMLFPFFNRDALRAGDVIAGTWVVEAPKRKLADLLSLSDGAQGHSVVTGADYRFGEEELSIYGEYELQTLERILREGRNEAMVAVAETIRGKIGWTGGEGDERAFLEAFYAQLRARLEHGMRFGKRKADKHG